MERQHDINKKTAHILKLTLIHTVIGLVCFLLLVSHVLTSDYDGLWYADAAYQSGAWEISLGRFMIPVIDFFRFALNVEPLQSVLTLAMLASGSVLLLDLFSFTDSKFSVPVIMLLCTSPTVCIFLSYRYTAPAYGLSYLLAVLSVWMLVKAERTGSAEASHPAAASSWLPFAQGERKQRRREILLTAAAAVTLVLTLGTYQAHLGCACVAILFYAVYLCMREHTSCKDVFRFLIRSVISGIAACAVYKVIWDITMNVTKAEVPDYRGAQGLSVVGMLAGLPHGVKQSYRFFYDQFFEAANRYNLLQKQPLYMALIGAWVFLAVFLVLYIAKKQGKKGVLAAVLFVVIPVACGVVCLLTSETGFVSMQMTMPYMMVAPLLLVLSAGTPDALTLFKDAPLASKKADRIVLAILCGLLLYGRICQTQVDQFVMYEGTKTTERMVSDAVAQAAYDGLLTEDNKLMFIGVPAENGLFRKSELFEQANGYAQFGQFWRGPYVYWRGYGGLLRRMGVNREVPDLETYVALMELEEVKNMPVYPDAGCMLLKDDVLIIKFANELETD